MDVKDDVEDRALGVRAGGRTEAARQVGLVEGLNRAVPMRVREVEAGEGLPSSPCRTSQLVRGPIRPERDRSDRVGREA